MKILGLLVIAFSFIFGSVDINSANVKELRALHGVGVKKAEAIVAYRKEHCFKNVDEIVKVKGIGANFLKKNRANMKAGACKK